MNTRTLLIALLGGVVSSLTACYPLYCWLPTQFMPDWPTAQVSLAWAGLALTVVVWLLTGAVAAREGGGSRSAALMRGAVAGGFAAWLMEILVGGAAAGLWGARLALAHGLYPAQNETEFLFLITHSVLSIIWGVHLSLWAVGASGALLGALGGWLAGPPVPQEHPDNAEWLTITALVIPVAAFSLLVFVALFDPLAQGVQRASEQAGFTLPYPAASVFFFPVATHMVWLLFWQTLAWRLTRRAVPQATLRLPLSALLFLLFTTLLSLAFFALLPPEPEILAHTPWFRFLGSAGLTGLALLAFWLTPKARLLAERFATFSILKSSRVLTFLRKRGEAQLAAWYFLVLSLLTGFGVAAVAGKNLLRHPWLPIGLILGIVLGGWGVWETRHTTPTSSAALSEPLLFDRSTWLRIGLWGGFLNALWLGLGALAPLALVNFSLRMIEPLRPHLHAGPQTLSSLTTSSLVQSHYAHPPLTLLLLLTVALNSALLFSAAMTVTTTGRHPAPASPSSPA